jgi:hypothetical protein
VLFRLLLLGENRFEHGLLQVGFVAATGGIDEGIRRAGFEFGVLLRHAVFGGVVAERDVTGQCADDCEGVVEFIDHGGRQHAGRAQAGVEDDLVSLADFGYRHSPGGGAARVASGKMCSEFCAAERNDLAVVDGAVYRCSLPPSSPFLSTPRWMSSG